MRDRVAMGYIQIHYFGKSCDHGSAFNSLGIRMLMSNLSFHREEAVLGHLLEAVLLGGGKHAGGRSTISEIIQVPSTCASIRMILVVS